MTLQKEIKDAKNKNILIVFQVWSKMNDSKSYHWIKPQHFPCSSTNPTVVDFSYLPFGADGGSTRDMELYIRQCLDEKRIPYDYDLDVAGMAERVASLGRVHVQRRLNKAAELAVQLGHTKITLDTFDLAHQELK